MNSTGNGGKVNYTSADGTLILMGDFGDGALFDSKKGTLNYREALSGLGDDAFVGPPKGLTDTLYIVGFKKGNRAGVINTYFKPGKTREVLLTMDQLKALAVIAMSRW